MTSQLSQSVMVVHLGTPGQPFFVEDERRSLSTDLVTLKASALEDLAEMISDRDPEVLKDLVETFLGEATRQVQNMVRALSVDDMSLLFMPAHSLKSSSATFGAMRLAQLTQQLETLVTGPSDQTPLRALVEQIRSEHVKVIAAMQNALAQWQA